MLPSTKEALFSLSFILDRVISLLNMYICTDITTTACIPQYQRMKIDFNVCRIVGIPDQRSRIKNIAVVNRQERLAQ